MQNQKFASVWEAIEDTPEEAENMKLRSSLMIALKSRLHKTGLTKRKWPNYSALHQRACPT